MKGIILAGGLGTRLRPLTLITNKHLLPVYDRPMIEYPLETLLDIGCDDILIITGGEHIGDFASYLGDGSFYNVKLTYRVQPKAGGVAEALGCAEGFIAEHDLFPVILGDNYFEEPVKLSKPGIILKEVENASRFGVYDSRANRVTEKPDKPSSNLAVTGLYWYDYKIFPFIRRLQPSERGELEITDVNNYVLENGGTVHINNKFWSDMGTFDSLMEVAKWVSRR